MRIALVSETYVPQVNGVSRTLEALVGHLAAQGDQVQLLIPRYHAAGLSYPPGVSAVCFRAVALPFYREVVLPLASPQRLRQELSDFNPDLVHIATEGPLGLAALKAAVSLGLPVVSSYHSNFSDYLRLYGFGWLEGLAWRYLRRIHNATALTFCPTPSICCRLEVKGFRNLQLWGRGIDCERFHPGKRDLELRRSWGAGPGDPVALYVGRLAKEKNLELLLAAWRQVPGENRRLLLTGDGPLRARLERLKDDRVLFTGYRQGEELARLYASADLFVFPSLTETFGNVVAEAMASGLPAVGFRVPGPQDVIMDGRTGMLVGEIAAGRFAVAIDQLLTTGEKRRQMGEAARAWAEDQSWSSILESVRKSYCQVAAGHRTGKNNPKITPP
ncbi:MAG: glycosyltransferase family 1 protein [Desulfuromonadales bacterium]|nr:glycosyltransferase family 1 protein [Desulfuromonadales bacterium]